MIFTLTSRKDWVLILIQTVSFPDKPDHGPIGPLEDQLGPKQCQATLTGSVVVNPSQQRWMTQKLIFLISFKGPRPTIIIFFSFSELD